jgi:hypothetical protein
MSLARIYLVPEIFEQAPLAELTAGIVSAYLSDNQITLADHGTSLGQWPGSFAGFRTVPVRRSIRQDRSGAATTLGPAHQGGRALDADELAAVVVAPLEADGDVWDDGV